MGWRDEYRPGAFRGVPFHLKNSTRTGGRRTVLNEYPLRDKPDTQDMGRKARQFNLVMTVIGQDYMAKRDQLIEALETQGSGTLMHPFYGEMQVAVLGDYSVEESTEQGGMARISQNFVESGEKPRPDNQPLAGAQVNSAADQVQEEAVAEFAEQWSVLGQAGFVVDGALAMLGDASALVGDAYSSAEGMASSAISGMQGLTGDILNAGGLLNGAGSFNTLFGRITGSFQQLILSPGNLGFSLLSLVRGMTVGLSPFGAFKAMAALFNSSSKAKAVSGGGYVTPSRAQQVANQTAVYTLIERVAVSEAARLATGRPVTENGKVLPGLEYDNRDQAVGVRDQVVAELDRQQLQASPERYSALVKLTAGLVADMNGRSATLVPLSRYQTHDHHACLVDCSPRVRRCPPCRRHRQPQSYCSPWVCQRRPSVGGAERCLRFA
ncbi:DNA circularization protein [Pseudomonas anguilliseptica]|uniref:DNA circularization protein n=1 Tax=Pseudomonas anguilliseptica TaxID=53406 RepID=UPI00325BB525